MRSKLFSPNLMWCTLLILAVLPLTGGQGIWEALDNVRSIVSEAVERDDWKIIANTKSVISKVADAVERDDYKIIEKANSVISQVKNSELVEAIKSDGSRIVADVKSAISQPGKQDDSKIVEAVKSIACSVLGMECCRAPYFKKDEAMRDFNNSLEHSYFGQDLAVETVIRALDGHLQDEHPSKALALSFHGWTGSGKTFISELIARSLFKKGLDSDFARYYTASHDFPNQNLIHIYYDNVRADIIKALRGCERALFVFDEVDNTPPYVFDAVEPFLDYRNAKIEGLEHKKAIFIFLSNTGANEIINIVYDAWKNGKRREDLKFKDFEESLSVESFNKKGSGLYKSSLIDRVLVDYFVPFLPMERSHVIQCAKAAARRLNGKLDNVDIEAIADSLSYWPPDIKKYSRTGCKKVENAVKYQLSAKRFSDRNGEEAYSEGEHNEL